MNDALGERLSDCLGVADDDPAGMLENERGLWLDLYYATPLGHKELNTPRNRMN